MLTVNLSKLSIQPNDRILDLGCGEGRHTLGVNYSYHDAHVVGVDINYRDLSIARQKHLQTLNSANYLYLQADAFCLPFADESYDHIICSEVLEHIDDYDSVLSEMQRILKPNGNLCVSVPRAWPERICWMLSREYHQVAGGHVRIFHTKHLTNSIKKLGFDFKSYHWAHALHAPYWWLRCLFWRKDENKQHALVKLYHRFLVWDMMKKPWFSQTLERVLNPLCGKSVVLYFKKITLNHKNT